MYPHPARLVPVSTRRAPPGAALFGSKSKELAVVDHGFDIPLNTAETFTLLGLRYAHLIRDRLKGDVQDRYSGALRQAQ